MATKAKKKASKKKTKLKVLVAYGEVVPSNKTIITKVKGALGEVVANKRKKSEEKEPYCKVCEL